MSKKKTKINESWFKKCLGAIREFIYPKDFGRNLARGKYFKEGVYKRAKFKAEMDKKLKSGVKNGNTTNK